MTLASDCVGMVSAKAAISSHRSASAICCSTPGSESTVTTSWLATEAVMHRKQS